MKDAQGYPLTTSSHEAARLYNLCQEGLLDYRTTTMQTIRDALAADPHFAMGHCLRGYLYMMFGSLLVESKANQSLQAAAAGEATPRERMHVEALRAWVEGRMGRAIAVWEQVLSAYPLDILALRLHHFGCFWTGRHHSLRGGAASVLDMWSADTPGYGNVLGMMSFGYEECGQYREAERFGRMAVEHAPDDLWAIHAVAHVLEMEDRQDEGIAWLTRPEDTWSDRNPFKGHLWWHLALFHIESGHHDRALDLYDRSVRNGDSVFYLDIQNAASLLARLELRGVDVGDRWAKLAACSENAIGDHAIIFTDLHHMMALAKDRRFDAAGRLLASMERFAQESPADSAEVVRTIGLPLCRGIMLFEQGEYAGSIEQLAPLHNNDAALGASHAQRDIVDQYLIEATVRGNRPDRTRMLLAERARLRPRNKTAVDRHREIANRIVEVA